MVNEEIPSAGEAMQRLKERGHTPTGLVVVGGNGDSQTTTHKTKFGTGIFRTVQAQLPDDIPWDSLIPKSIELPKYTQTEKDERNKIATRLEYALRNLEEGETKEDQERLQSLGLNLEKRMKYFDSAVVVPVDGSYDDGLKGLLEKIHKDQRSKEPLTKISEEAVKNFNRLLFNGVFPIGVDERGLENRTIKPHYTYGLPYEAYIDISKQSISEDSGMDDESKIAQGTAIIIQGNMMQNLQAIGEEDLPLMKFVLLDNKEFSYLYRSVHGPQPVPPLKVFEKEDQGTRDLRRYNELKKFREENPEYPGNLDLDNPKLVQLFRDEYAKRYRMAILGQVEDKDTGSIIADKVLTRALDDGASDFHIDPKIDPKAGAAYSVYARVDGRRKRIRCELTPEQGNDLINALVTQAARGVRDRRLPFDGNVNCKFFGRPELFLRLSTIPSGTYFSTKTGKEEPLESLVARIAEMHGKAMSVEKLGMPKYLENTLQKMANQIKGINILIGATGQGKTTTLAAVLQLIEYKEHRVITLENPIERSINEIIHTEENSESGYTIEKFARAFVRQDPDIVMEGEIRDDETYKFAADASITGHLVFTTLHADNVLEAPSRLFGLMANTMQARKYNNIMAKSIRSFLAQKLATKLCKKCNDHYDGTAEIADMLECPIETIREIFPEPLMLYKPNGRASNGEICKDCKGKGEKGRIVIPQYLPMTKELRRLYINMDEDEDKYLQEGRKAGLLTFPELGMLYAISGFISLDEMKRSIADEEDIFTERDNMVNMIKKWQHHKDWYTSDHNPFIKV